MSVQSRLKKNGKQKKSKRLFMREKMWLSYLVSNYIKDVGKIPKDIGNNILISNNMYISSEYLSSIIQIHEWNNQAPVTLIKELNAVLRKANIVAILDMTVKNNEFYINPNESGIRSRVAEWERIVELGDEFSNDTIRRSATLLYTVNEAKKGKRLYKSKISLTVRAKTRSILTQAETALKEYMDGMEWTYRSVNDVKNRLRYTSLLSDSRDSKGSEIPNIITSNTLLSQLFANGSSPNDDTGMFIGINIDTNSPFKIDLSKVTLARNFYGVAPSGVGKTVMGQRWAESALETTMHCSITDIKGNEFSNFTIDNNGVIISLRPTSQQYLDTFKMHASECSDTNCSDYFNSRVEFSKNQFSILSGVKEENRQQLNDLLEEFFNALYISIGAIPTNRNTWHYTLDLNPYSIYKMLKEYITPSVVSRYPETASQAIKSLHKYMDERGSQSHIFREELNYREALDAPVITFDFGLLDNADTSLTDMELFELKFSYMRKLNAEFVANKYNKGIRVFRILEESQIVNDSIMRGYVEEYTLRRAQQQTTLLLGNSVQALLNSQVAKPLIENTNALLIGKLPDSALNTLVKEFDLEDYRDDILRLGTDEESTNAFLFINRLEPRPLVPTLKFILDKNKKYRLHTPNKTGGD